MPRMLHYKSVDAYIASQPKSLQPKLQQLRETILKAAPGAEESVSYSMPAYKNAGRPLVYFAACKTHIGLYAMPKAVTFFKDQLSGFDISKGTIRLPLDKPLPLKLMRLMVKFRVEKTIRLNKEKQAQKQKKGSSNNNQKTTSSSLLPPA